MIRVKIAGEEVLSNKNFTITEELLKTSSTILDNVYPKAWEETHDYVNNFYFPKDYSSCTIENVEPITPIIGTRVSGSNLSLNYDNTLSWDLEQLKGNTTQNGTPTPSSPIPVNNVTGRQEIDIVGKNYLDYSKIVKGRLDNGVIGYASDTTNLEYTDNSIIFTTIANWRGVTSDYIEVQPNTSYMYSADKNLSATTYQIEIDNYNKNKEFLYRATLTRVNNTATYTTNSNVKYIRIYFTLPSAGTYTINNAMLEKGSTQTTYEPYIGKQYEINLVKENIFNFDNYATKSANVEIVSQTEDTLVATVNQATTWQTIRYNINNLKKNNDYSFKFDFENTYTSDLYKHTWITIKGENGNNIYNDAYYKDDIIKFNTGNNTTIGFLFHVTINSPAVVNTITINNVKLQENIELCKIGDYQDYIYKNNNKWYIHKEIGKVVLNGTENWQASSQYSGWYITVSDIKIGDAGNITASPIYCNYYTQLKRNVVLQSDYGIATGSNQNITFRNKDYVGSTKLNNWKSWLSTHNTEVYYVFATPTNTEITDTELINQLEDIELLNGLNNISIISPNENGELQIYYNYRNAGEDTELIFAGLVKNSGSISLRPTDPKYCSLQILDYKTLLSEGQTLDYVINNKTIKEAIQMVINSVTSYGFIEGNIDIDAANDVIGAYSTLNKTPYDVFQYLADISQSKWFTRVIDEKTIAIDFYDPDKLPKADDIEYTEQYFKDNNIVDINYSFSSSDYRNKQIILSEKVYGNVAVNDVITCNGYEQTFTTSQIIGTISSIKVNNVEKTYVTNTEKSLGIIADFYYAPNNNTVESAELYDAGDIIVISYMPLIKGRRVITNDDEISRINNQINRNGIISRYEERNDIVDGDELGKVAETYIRYKGTSEIKLNVLTENKDLFNIGQQVYFDMPNVERLATDYMVKKKNIEIIQTGEYKNVFYTYELTSNFNSETDINFFDNQRRKAEGNISEDQFITRNVDVNNTANIIFDNLQIEEVQTTGNNTLNCTLNSPFIN